jgi:hypothetical protein
MSDIERWDIQVRGVDPETRAGLGEMRFSLVDHGRSATVYVEIPPDPQLADRNYCAGNNPPDLERRLIIARALAAEHGMPLGFHDEGDQLEWDRKACQVLRDLAAVESAEVPQTAGPPRLLPCPECAGKGFARFDPFNTGTGREARCGRCGGRGTLKP